MQLFPPRGLLWFFKFFGNYYYSCVLWFPACLTKECLVAWTVYRLSSVWIRYIAWHNMAQPAELDICLCMQLCVWLLWIGSRTFSRNFYRENFQWNCNLRFQRSITFCEYILNTVFLKIRYCLASFCFYFNICTIIQPYLNTLDMQLSVDSFLTFKSKCLKKLNVLPFCAFPAHDFEKK